MYIIHHIMLKHLFFIFAFTFGLITPFTVKPTPAPPAKPSVSTFNEYVEATLQSTGLKSYDPEFLTKYHERLNNRTSFFPPTPVRFTLPPNFTRPPTPRLFPYPYPLPFGCLCEGCSVNGECVGCLNRPYCERIGGRYCED